jgi:hypothetical protein
MENTLIQIWQNIIEGDEKSWVLFENGTCVILMKPEAELAAQALQLMREYGSVHGGSPAGDFSIIKLRNDPGWAVTSHHPDMLTYVSPGEIEESENSDLRIGLLGRSKRDQDAKELQIIHVEDNRAAASNNSFNRTRK